MHLAPPQKQSSRFSALSIFKLRQDAAPPPPPKDPPSDNKSLFSRSTASLAPSLSPDSNGPPTPASPYLPMPTLELGKRAVSARQKAASPAPSASGGSLNSLGRGAGDYPSIECSTDSSGSCNRGVYLLHEASTSACAVGPASARSKKSMFRLAGLAKRNRSRKDLSDTASASDGVSRSTSVSDQAGQDGDEGITMPWNFQHHIHVDEGYIGLPPSWTAALSQVGFDDDEIAAIHARRRAAATGLVPNAKLATTYSTERPPSPRMPIVTPPSTSTSLSSSATLLEPTPRSTSLARGRNALTIHPPSIYSVATSTGRTSPAPSPRTPSFLMKSLVSGIKNSLTSDSASAKEEAGLTEGASGEESEQYVLVDGDGPDEGGDQVMGDDTLIEPYPYDTASVSSHHTHTSSTRQASQGQHAPRTPAFPQIQVQRAQSDVGHGSLVSCAPSPLAHSTSLPIPTPPHGYARSNHSASPPSCRPLAGAGPRLGPVSAPPRTPPRRIYHVVNKSSDSYDGPNYAEPPPAYASPTKEEWIPRKEKEGFGVFGGPPPPPPNRPIPPVPAAGALGEPSGTSSHDSRVEDQEASMAGDSDDVTSLSANDIPRTADEVLDISSYYSDNSVHGGGAGVDPTEEAGVLSPTPPLVIDKRVAKLATLPPRISFHQEGSLEDWSESLFSVIGKRSSILMGPKGGNAASINKKRRSTIRPLSPLSMADGNALTTASSSLSLGAAAPSLPDLSSGANLALAPRANGTVDAIEEGDEQGQAEESAEAEGEQATEADTTMAEQQDESPVAPPTPLLPDVSLGPNVSSIGEDLDPPASMPPSPSGSPLRTSIDSLPPSPPPKPKPKPAPIALPPAITLAPPRTNVITGISGKSPVNPLFGARPQPLPIPIPPSQIRAQLRPAPPKSPHPPPTLPLPPLKRIPSQPNLQPPIPSHSQLPLLPSPRKAVRHDSATSRASPSHSRPNSSQTLLPVRANSGDRDSGMSTITVTPATIATAKAEVVRTAVASVIDSDAVSLASKRESAADIEPQTLVHAEDEESPRAQEAPDDSLVSETSSVSLLRHTSQSKWPAPPPPPVELEADSTPPRRMSRFRTTSLGRVTHLQAIGATTASPSGSHSSQGSSDTTSGSTSESTPVMTPKGLNEVSPLAVPKTRGGLAAEARLLSSTMETFGGVDVEEEEEEEEEDTHSRPPGTPLSESHTSLGMHPLLAQLQLYITPRDPASCFSNLVEIAEGESGSVFAARVSPAFADAWPQGQQDDTERPIPPNASHVAIKRIPLPPVASLSSLSDDSPVSNKLVSVLHELSLLRNLDHEHLLLLDAIYVSSNTAEDVEFASAVDTSLWIRMELMERSLADVIGLVAEGLALQERLIGRFASDILHGLDYLQKQHIAHRDVRSDNLLVNAAGVVKLADFSNAVRVERNVPTVTGAVGVIYWQAPEMRAGPYNALKVDTWSLGATVWELAETVPPFSTPASPSTQVLFAIQTARHLGPQWPPLSHPEHYSRAFHEFLRLCGRESAERPCPEELLNTSFIRNACGRPVILQLLSQCRAIEETMVARGSS